jgi:DNA-binding transcriptional ArsR family regulator
MNQKREDPTALARAQQQAEARAGGPVRSISDILKGKASAPIDLTRRQLRRRGAYGAAALLTDQAALREKNPIKATKARVASGILKELAEQAAQLEFDFFMGNVSVGQQFHDTIRDRLLATGETTARRLTAAAVLNEITRWLGWQSYECTKSARELEKLLNVEQAQMSRALMLLERVGAIRRVKRGTMKTICITPEGAYRGDINKHAEAVARYHKEVVVPLRPDLTPAG